MAESEKVVYYYTTLITGKGHSTTFFATPEERDEAVSDFRNRYFMSSSASVSAESEMVLSKAVKWFTQHRGDDANMNDPRELFSECKPKEAVASGA